jgi:hypothetical protein
MTDPSDVGTTELYSYPEAPNPAGEIVRRFVEALRAPDESEGWPRIVVPAIVTGLAVEAARRVMT